MDNLPTMDTLFAPPTDFSMRPKKGQPLNNGQNACSERFHYSEVPLYILHWVKGVPTPSLCINTHSVSVV